MTAHAEGYDLALKTLRNNLSPRYLDLDVYERYVDGSQYEHLRYSWFNDEVPLLDRRPSIIDPVVEEAIGSYVDLVLGDKRWPTITSGTGEDDEAFDPRLGLNPSESEELDRLIQHIEKQTKLQVVCQEALGAAQGCGTTVAIACVRHGHLAVDLTRAKWCNPTFDHDGKLVELEIRYPYIEEYYDDHQKKLYCRTRLYRRVINTLTDIVYKPAVASTDGEEPDKWIPDVIIEHNYGFCPCTWYAYDRRISTVANFDGRPIHKNLLGNIDALNRGRSQRDRAAVYSGDPQTIEIGVDEKHNPAPTGPAARQTMAKYSGEGKGSDPEKWRIGGADHSGGGTKRKRGPGQIWRYPANDGKTEVFMLTLDAGSLRSIAENADDILAGLADAMAWVRVDSIRARSGSAGLSLNTVSGKALEWMYRKQLSRCDRIRTGFRDGFLLPLLNILLRMVFRHATSELHGTLYLAGIETARTVLKKFEQPVKHAVEDDADPIAPSLMWFEPSLTLQWGAYFEASDDDHEKQHKTVREDLAAAVITTKSAVEKIADYYGIDNVDQYIKNMGQQGEESGSSHEDDDEEKGNPEHLSTSGNPDPSSNPGFKDKSVSTGY